MAKSKSWNLLESRSRNVFRFKKVQSTSTIEKLNFLTSNTKVVFTKLREAFIQILSFWYFSIEYHIWMKINIVNDPI